MEDDRLKTALLEWESEGGSAEMPPPELARASPPETSPGLDPRHRRGSFGPIPMAAPLDQNASSAALRRHLVQLIDVSRRAPQPAQRQGDADALDADAIDAEAIDAETLGAEALGAEALDAEALDAEHLVIDAEQELGPHEDLERQPDGIPHLVIGLTALFSVALAAVVIGMFRSGPTLGSIASVVIAMLAIPVLVFRLGAKAERERDHDHPSR